jgi:D-galactose 1-dehydrogenase
VTRYRIGIIGLGRIARDQHLPAIAGSEGFTLAAVVSRHGPGPEGVPVFPTAEAMLAAVPDLAAVAVCTPPQVRHALARAMLAAGRHVLLEKPPTATLGELRDLEAFARAQGRVLFAAWHSQFNPAVEAAREALRGQTLARLEVVWKEDVRRWHPGQRWIWQAGGMGVFDPGINALSILSRILPETLFVRRADLLFPTNCDAPIAADLAFATAGTLTGLAAAFDWRQEGEQSWTIGLETRSGRRLALEGGGRRLEIEGGLVVDRPAQEYEAIYDRFAQLLRAGRSEVDAEPLRLVADAFLIGRRVPTAPFLA